jgi:dienelactone hydrolase
MTDIVLFPSVLGVREGVDDAAARLRANGHSVHVVDPYGGRAFDDYDEAAEYEQSIGYPELMRRAAAGARDVPDGFVTLGFSNGAALAEYLATQRPAAGVLLLSGALDPAMLGVAAWPAGVPAQIHIGTDDPFRDQAGIDAVVSMAGAAAAVIEVFDYPVAGHLFTDRSLAAEYDQPATDLLWSRVLKFCADRPNLNG